jgi:lipid-binding SYLF domain-containing protein
VAHGFVISKLHTTGKDPLQEPQWSAPLFVRVHVVNAGILLGFSRSKTLLLSMNDGLLKELMQRGR